MQTPVARASDPDTSHEAGEKFKRRGMHLTHHDIIADSMNSMFAFTSKEISKWCGLNQWQVSRRMGEMEQLNIVIRCDKKMCSILKSKCVSWKLKFDQ